MTLIESSLIVLGMRVERKPSTLDVAPKGRQIRAFGSYQSGLDGLRGYTIPCVLLFHAGMGPYEGFYLSLSLFFSLSGFLITAILLDDSERAGRLDLKRFAARRLRRITPAALAGVVLAIIYGATIATRSQAEHLVVDLIGVIFYVVNWVFIATEHSYTDAFSAPSPVQHYWSLAVEEQFYAVIPLLLGILMWAKASHRAVVGLLSTVVIGSTYWMYYLYNAGTGIDRLYYGTDTRIAEVMVGVLLAVVMHHRNGQISERVRQILSWAGWLAILVLSYMWTTFGITESFAYQGGFLLNALLTSTVIMAIISRRGVIDRVFNWAPAIWLGVLAYGIYIYHFVIFLWLTPERTGLDPWPNLALRFAVTLLFAWTSHRFLETPILKGATFGLPKAGQLMLYPVVGLMLIGIASLTVNTGGADPLATLRDDGRSQRAPVAAADGVLDILVIYSAEHAAIVDELEAKLADDSQIRVSARSVFSCDGGWVDVDGSPACANWAAEWPALIVEHDPDSILFFVDDWAGDDISKFVIKGAGSERAIGKALLGTGFDMLTSQGASVSQVGSGQAFKRAFARGLSPYYQSLADLGMRPDLNLGSDGSMPNPTEVDTIEYLNASAESLLDLAALYQRADRAGMPRVLIIGDSQARSLGFGLERWGFDHGIWVWNAATNGCGIADEGNVYYWGGKEARLRPECVAAVAAYKDQV
ncbi:MAG: acyltransferase, partial [Gammaproteobacteria bacterium]|nr:acyltransferase [Gammaproteobacteria bacterium]